MIEEETKGGLDFEALRDAIERCEAEALIGFYSEEAELRILNGSLPEGMAFELKGRAEIERYLRAVCDQKMTCVLEGQVIFCEESIVFGQVCAYPGGTLISLRTTLEIAEGKIVRQTDVARSARHNERSER